MEEKKTRGNKKLLVVLAMVFLLIAIFALGGYTFAKYITSANTGTQQATVAKWGYVVTVDTSKMFYDAYNDDNSKATWVAAGTVGNGIKVSADTEDNNKVAPGTSGEMTITITGVAEVAAKLSYTAATGVTTSDVSLTRAESGTVGSDGYVSPVDYHPIKWTIKKGTDEIEYESGKNATDTTLENCLKALEKQCDAVMAPGDQTFKDGVTYTLSWKWAFDSTEDSDIVDAYDTILSHAANNETGDILEGCTANTEIEFGFTIAIEQSKTGTVAGA